MPRVPTRAQTRRSRRSCASPSDGACGPEPEPRAPRIAGVWRCTSFATIAMSSRQSTRVATALPREHQTSSPQTFVSRSITSTGKVSREARRKTAEDGAKSSNATIRGSVARPQLAARSRLPQLRRGHQEGDPAAVHRTLTRAMWIGHAIGPRGHDPMPVRVSAFAAHAAKRGSTRSRTRELVTVKPEGDEEPHAIRASVHLHAVLLRGPLALSAHRHRDAHAAGTLVRTMTHSLAVVCHDLPSTVFASSRVSSLESPRAARAHSAQVGNRRPRDLQ